MALVLAFEGAVRAFRSRPQRKVCDLAFLTSNHRHEMATYVPRIAARTPTLPRRNVADNKFGREWAAE